MFAVGRIGSYISRGVYTVSGPFHPFGGAVDIIVVEQPDGSYKSSPWYVRFGKFQGVLKASEKIVRINVNGVDADFHMHLDHKGEAFFLQEVDVVDGEQAEPYMSSGDEVDLRTDNWRHQKSKSCNFDAKGTNLVLELEGVNGKILGRSNSRHGRLFGLSFGRRSMKENGFKEGEESVEVHRATSLERAEMAADLMEVRWTTNLGSSKKLNVNSPRGSNAKPPVAAVVGEVVVENKANVKDSSSIDYDGSKLDSKCSFEENDIKIPCSTNRGNCTEILRIEETYMGVDFPSFRPEISNKLDVDDLGNKTNAQSSFSEVSTSILKVSCKLDAEQNDSGVSSGDEVSSVAIVSQSGGAIKIVSGIDKVESTMCPDTIEGLHNCNGESSDRFLTSVEAHREPKNQLLLVSSEPVVTVSMSEMHEKEDSSESASCILGEISCNNAEIQVSDNNGTAPKIGDVLSEDCDLKKEVEKTSSNVHLDNSTPLETCNCANRLPNELRSGDLCSSTGDLSSLSGKESSTVQDVGEYLGNPTHERGTNATPSEYSEEEQFAFSDLDDPKVEKAEGFGALPTDGGEERLSQDSGESSTEELMQTNIRDDEPHQASDKHLHLLNGHPSPKVNPSCASSPIIISKVHKDVDLDYLAPVVESLPDILFTDGNVNLGVPEPLSRSVDSNLEALKILNNDVPVSSDLGAKQQQVADVQSATDSSQISEEIKRIFSDPAVEVSLCRDYLYEGMGYEAAALAFDSKKLETDKLSSYDSDIVKDDKLVVRIGGLYFPWEAALPIASAIGSQEREQILEPKGMIAVGQNDKNSEEMPQKSVNSSGSWRIWPFSLKKSNSMKDKNSDSGTASENSVQKDVNTDADKTKVKKKMVKVKAPTSEQLASLNLKDGKNVITFTFSTAMLGNQQVDARIFLWKWNTRIVISDVDGTITKSDVLGQFMPLMGIDWSQTGVTHLFSAIKENGYNLMFLSARSISQAYHTRQFLVNLKQDGKPLPEGPIVISPDGLFPSLYREVIRRAPHEFKISCLEDIKALFPRDHNPFYAGFGNRDTDEFSYLKVGIPRGKIFTINPRGEVVVNRRVDTKSYTSLSILVHDMFPPTRVTEQEDYNSWNFWRLPPPDFEF